MKHDILIINNNKVVRTKFFSTSYEVWESFFLYYDITPEAVTTSIQLDYFEDPALLIDYSDKSVTAFRVNDLGTILLIKYIASRYNEYGFSFFIQEAERRRLQKSYYDFFDNLLTPLCEGIMKKHLTLFN